MYSNDYEIFYNWTNSSKFNDHIQLRTITAKVQPLLKKAYSIPQIEEILVADGYKHNLIKEALSLVDNSSKPRPVEAKTESTFPKSYSDLSQKFETVLASHGPTKFVNLLTDGENPLLKISRKDKDTLQRIADSAYENSIHLAALHAFIKPSIISELAENVCRARKIKENCKLAQTSKDEYKIVHNGKTITASVSPVKSSSSKFASSNYEIFGFPDEYVILAHEESSPYASLKRDLAK